MIKNILVCTDGSTSGDAAREYGVFLARGLKARLTGLHVLDSRTLEGPLMTSMSGWLGALPYNIAFQQFRDFLQQRGATIIGAFSSRCAEEQLAAETRLLTGHPARIILEEETRAELLILGQKGEHAEWLGDATGSTTAHVLRHSIKPLLVTPAEFKPIRKILAAYDGSGHASQALHEAAELAAALGAPLGVITVAPGKNTEEANEISRDGLKMARAHDCQASHLVGSGDAHVVILEAAAEYGYDLIVAGAFGHGRIREMIVGSTAQQLATRSPAPVMLVR